MANASRIKRRTSSAVCSTEPGVFNRELRHPGLLLHRVLHAQLPLDQHQLGAVMHLVFFRGEQTPVRVQRRGGA